MWLADGERRPMNSNINWTWNWRLRGGGADVHNIVVLSILNVTYLPNRTAGGLDQSKRSKWTHKALFDWRVVMGGHYIYEIIRNLFPKKLTETVIHLLTDHVVLNLCIRFVSEYCLLYIQGYKLNRSRKKDMLRGGWYSFFGASQRAEDMYVYILKIRLFVFLSFWGWITLCNPLLYRQNLFLFYFLFLYFLCIHIFLLLFFGVII